MCFVLTKGSKWPWLVEGESMSSGLSRVGYIYVLKDPLTFEIRYVGQTKNTLDKRLYKHCFMGHKAPYSTTHRIMWVNQMIRRGTTPIIEPVQVLPLTDLDAAERYWITYFRAIGCDLTNVHVGGGGGWDHLAGGRNPRVYRPLTQDTKDLISAKLVGRTLPQSTRDKMSAARQRDRELIAAKNRVAWDRGDFGPRRPPKSSWYGYLTCPVCNQGPFKGYRGMRKHMTQTICDELVRTDA